MRILINKSVNFNQKGCLLIHREVGKDFGSSIHEQLAPNVGQARKLRCPLKNQHLKLRIKKGSTTTQKGHK